MKRFLKLRIYFTRKNFFIFIAASGLLAIFIYLTVSFYVLHKLTHPAPKPLNFDPVKISSNYEAVKFPSRLDNLQIAAWFIEGNSENAVILVSGSDQNRIDPGYGSDLVAKDLLQEGYNVLLFDFRGRGQSEEGLYALGAHEKRDLAGAYDFLVGRGFASKKIGILAISLGAGTTFLALPQIPEVGGIVADSSYSDIRTLIARELPGRSRLPKIFTFGLGLWSEYLYGIKLDEMVPEKILARYPDRKFLLIHGAKDEDIPPQDSINLARSSPKSEIWIVTNSGHVKAYRDNPNEYIRRVKMYFDSQFNGGS